MKNSYTIVLRNETNPFINTTRWILILLKVLLIPVLAIIQVPYWWILAIVLAAASFLEYRMMKLVPSVTLSNDTIIFNGVVKKKYHWPDIQNVMLKEGLLTVDLRNNRLLQKETDSRIDEHEFNEWCSEKLYGLKG